MITIANCIDESEDTSSQLRHYIFCLTLRGSKESTTKKSVDHCLLLSVFVLRIFSFTKRCTVCKQKPSRYVRVVEYASTLKDFKNAQIEIHNMSQLLMSQFY